MRNNITITVVATENLSGDGFRHRVVDIDGTLAQASSAISGGTLQTPTKTGSGESITLTALGDTFMRAGGAVTNGAKLSCANSGWVTAATSAQVAAGNVIGKALEAANSGDIFRGFVNFANG